MRRCLAGLLLLAGCIDIPPPLETCDPANPDADHDGWRCDGIVPDCDDTNADINPGAIDSPFTTDVDEDCNGIPAHTTGQIGGVSLVAGAFVTPTQRIDLAGTGALMPTGFVDLVNQLSWLPMGGTTLDVAGASAAFSLDDATGTRTFAQQGPAYADVRITWSAPPTTSAPAVSGVTRFAVRPDGITVRDDEVTVNQPGFASADGPFDASAAVHVVRGGAGATRVDVSDGIDTSHELTIADGATWDGAANPAPWVCFTLGPQSEQRYLSMMWRAGGTVGPHLSIGTDIEVGYDWARQAASLPAGTYAATQILGYSVDGGCFGSPGDHLSPAPLFIQQGEVWTDSTGDRDHDGYDEARGTYWIVTDGLYVAFSSPSSGPFLVRAVMRTSTAKGVTVWEDDTRLEAGSDYLVQWTDGDPSGNLQETRQAAIVWFPRLTTGFLRIAEPGGEPTPP